MDMSQILAARENLGKKSHQRVLAVLAENTTQGGILLADIPQALEQKFGKKHCSAEVVTTIISDLEILDLTLYQEEGQGVTASRRYGCSKKGLEAHENTVRNNPKLLEKTTSPDCPMFA